MHLPINALRQCLLDITVSYADHGLELPEHAVIVKGWLTNLTAPTLPEKHSLFFPKLYKMAMEKGVRFHLDGCKIHLSQMGILSVVNPVYGAGYYGKFDRSGNFKPTKECTEEILAQLYDIEENGVEAAKRIGLLTGTCCVCGRSLTNEGSIEAGIGPICASKFGG